MRARWLSRRAISLHVRCVLIVVACVVAAWWQATRALAGNGLSWFYTLEWPAFAILAIAGWWHLVHEDPEHFRARKQRRLIGASAPGPEEIERLDDPYEPDHSRHDA